MNTRGGLAFVAMAVTALGAVGCGSQAAPGHATRDRPEIVVTYSVLGSVVADVVGDAGRVVVLMPNGANPHEWSPSARDVERMLGADLVIDNGLGLESNLQDPLRQAAADGVRVFTVADHVTVRKVGTGEGADSSDPDQAAGADDPHLWMDPLTMRQWVGPLVTVLHAMGIDVAANGSKVETGLEAVNHEVEAIVGRIPAERRRLVTGHESMGYFADRYHFDLIGSVVSSLTSQAEPSAGKLAALTHRIRAAGVPAIFAEIGTPAATVRAIAGDAHTKVIEMSTHNLPADGTYRSFIVGLATTIADALS